MRFTHYAFPIESCSTSFEEEDNFDRSTCAGYLPTLQALAIVTVIFHHDSVHRAGWLSTQRIYIYEGAVSLFFSVEWDPDCSRLLDEKRMRGRIDIKGHDDFLIEMPFLKQIVLSFCSIIAATLTTFGICTRSVSISFDASARI
jgi:hypothetical protein